MNQTTENEQQRPMVKLTIEVLVPAYNANAGLQEIEDRMGQPVTFEPDGLTAWWHKAPTVVIPWTIVKREEVPAQ